MNGSNTPRVVSQIENEVTNIDKCVNEFNMLISTLEDKLSLVLGSSSDKKPDNTGTLSNIKDSSLGKTLNQISERLNGNNSRLNEIIQRIRV